MGRKRNLATKAGAWATALWLAVSLSFAQAPALSCADLFARVSAETPAGAEKKVVKLLHKIQDPYFRYGALTEAEKSLLNSLDVARERWPAKADQFFPFLVRDLAVRAEEGSPVALAVQRYQEHSLAQVSQTLAPTKASDTSRLSAQEDIRELVRGYGYLLLPRHDQAFEDPKFLANLLRQRGQTAAGYPNFDPNDAKKLFNDAFARLSEKEPYRVVPVAHALHGSDANTLFTEIADWVVSLKKGQRAKGQVLYFEDNYIAARGPLRMYRFFDRGGQGPWTENLIPSPLTHRPPSAADLGKPLNAEEKKALALIRERAARGDVGGIQIETIPSARGVYFYRANFIKALRELADELGVPVLADEVFNGGGRTGKSFGFQHYPGFVPDFVTFGKGVGTAGLADVRGAGRAKFSIESLGAEINAAPEAYGLAPHFRFKFYDSTIDNTADAYLKSAAILNRIENDHLIENADKVGKYFHRRLSWFETKFLRWPRGIAPEGGAPARHAGLLIGNARWGRYSPAITIAKADVENAVRQRVAQILYGGLGDLEKVPEEFQLAPAALAKLREEIAALEGLPTAQFEARAMRIRDEIFGARGALNLLF